MAVVLVGALLVAQTCGSNKREISKEEAIEIARERASFTPCEEQRCVQVRNVPRGIPPRRYWLVGLAEGLDSDGRPERVRSFLVDAETGEVSPV